MSFYLASLRKFLLLGGSRASARNRVGKLSTRHYLTQSLGQVQFHWLHEIAGSHEETKHFESFSRERSQVCRLPQTDYIHLSVISRWSSTVRHQKTAWIIPKLQLLWSFQPTGSVHLDFNASYQLFNSCTWTDLTGCRDRFIILSIAVCYWIVLPWTKWVVTQTREAFCGRIDTTKSLSIRMEGPKSMQALLENNITPDLSLPTWTPFWWGYALEGTKQRKQNELVLTIERFQVLPPHQDCKPGDLKMCVFFPTTKLEAGPDCTPVVQKCNFHFLKPVTS